MANNDKSFADRLGRARTLHGTIQEFEPDFAPADASLFPAAFETFVNGVEAANRTLDEKKGIFSDEVGERLAIVKDVKSRAQRAASYVKSNTAWSKRWDTMKSTYDKLKGYRPARVQLPKDDSTAERKKAKTGQQSFADIEGLFAKLIKALEKVPGYAPPAAELTLPALTALDTAFRDKNVELASLEPEIALLIDARLALYDTLREKVQSIKSAASAQYGHTSPQYRAIKGLRF